MPITASRSPVWLCREKIHLTLLLFFETRARARAPQDEVRRGSQARPPRRGFLQLGGAAMLAPALVCGAAAQTYPSRPITMIVPFPPGGNVDVVGRVLAERMRGPLGQPIIIENIAGANGSIGVGRN